MKDVAALAGVSLATVSRVVNGSDDVRADLRERVEKAVELLGYRRDITASALRRSDRLSASIGLVLEDVSNPFFSALYRGVEDAARVRRVLVFAGSSDDDPGRERELADAFAARRVDGIIIAPSGADQSHLARERAAGIPVVFVDRTPRLIDADAVLSDNAGGMAGGVEHLIELGHERIAFLGDRLRISTASERLRGYRTALDRHRLRSDDRMIRTELVDSAVAREATLELLTGPDRPTALCTGQNLITVGAMRALRELGLQNDVALIGFDDLVMGDMVEPGITVVAQDPAAVGRTAAELLFSRVAGDQSPYREMILPTRLVARGSGEIPPPAVSGVAASSEADRG